MSQPQSSTTAHPMTQPFTWTRDTFLITTDLSLLDPTAINEAFATDALGWAIPLPTKEINLMLEKSLCLGLYDTSKSRPNANPNVTPAPTPGTTNDSTNNNEPKSPRLQIGLARLITDYTTLAYLTDVYVHPDYQGLGLGHWLIQCVKEWTEKIPYLRRVVLVAKEGSGEAYYARTLGTGRPEDEGTSHRIYSSLGPGLVGWKKG